MKELFSHLTSWLANPSNVLTMFGDIFSTFIAAALAFWFGKKLYQHQKHRENLGYLQYVVATLVGNRNHLYVFKLQMVLERYEEANDLVEQMENPKPDADGNSFYKIEKMSLFMHEPGTPWPITHEKLDFLANRDPNLFVILSTAASSVKTLNSMVVEINAFLTSARAAAPNTNDFNFLIQNTILLKKQTDSTIYLTDKCIELLCEYGRLEFKRDMKIVKSEFTNPNYAFLKPPPIESWEVTQWFPSKRNQFVDRVKKLFLKKFRKDIANAHPQVHRQD